MEEDGLRGIRDGDVVNVDERERGDGFGKDVGFLKWVFDDWGKGYVWGRNVVVVEGVVKRGLEYGLF